MSVKKALKILLRSGSWQFTRDSLQRGAPASLRTYRWKGVPIQYRPGTSDTGLIYDILLKRGRKGEYSVPRESRLDAASVNLALDPAVLATVRLRNQRFNFTAVNRRPS